MRKHLKGFTAFFIVSLLLCLSAASPAADTVLAPGATSADVPILMYHGLTDRQDKVNEYFIPASTFRSDMKYLSDNGYTAITMTQLINFVYDTGSGACLPEKPVIITFDDGYYNNHLFATPVLKEYGMKAVISIVGSACQEASEEEYMSDIYRNVTWTELSEMAESGQWEIQNHTWNMHKIDSSRKGARKNPGESTGEYARLLKEDLLPLQDKIKECTGRYPDTFTWPFGMYTPGSRDLLRSMGFKAGLICASGINHIEQGDKDAMFGLKRGLRTPDVSIEKLLR